MGTVRLVSGSLHNTIRGAGRNHRKVTLKRCVTNVKFSGMNLKVTRSVTRALNTICSAPRNITYTVVLPVIVRCGRRYANRGCHRVTETVNMGNMSRVSRSRCEGTTVRTIGGLSISMKVPAGLRTVGRRSLRFLTRSTRTSTYTPKGPGSTDMRSLGSLFHGVVWLVVIVE